MRKTLGMPNLIRGRKRVILGNLKGCGGGGGLKIKSPEYEGQSTLSQFTNIGSNSNMMLLRLRESTGMKEPEPLGFTSSFGFSPEYPRVS
jgi:hypothetical protein